MQKNFTIPSFKNTILKTGCFSIYFDVRGRQLTYLEHPPLQEVASVGPDTATRIRTVLLVKDFLNRNVPLGTYSELIPSSNISSRAYVSNSIRYRRNKGTTTPLDQIAHDTTGWGSDLGIELIDAWSTVADVLTFYQERIASEGYLRKGTERRSILELRKSLDAIITKYAISDSQLANTCKKSKEDVISLFDLLPKIYQRRDRERGQGALQALLEVIEQELEILIQDIENLYNEWCIQTPDPWEVPYTGNSIVEDPFNRRIKFITESSFPIEETRLDIWKQVFPQNIRLYKFDFEDIQKKPKEH